jgi:ATP-dependent RNA helicase RhlE
LNFDQLGLIEPLLRALKTEGYTTPTPVQEQCIPYVLQRHDVLGCAQTGTGKTAAFALPILQILHNSNENSKGYKHIRALVLTPTRELAVQIDESFAAYGRFTSVTGQVIYGGVSQHTQTLALRNGTDVLVATPGRLLDLMNQGYVHLDHLELFVLDEADRMLDMGFINDVKKIIRALPQERQTLFFSATMPPQIAQLADSLLYYPEKVEVTPVSSTAERIEQSVYLVAKHNKQALLVHLLQTAGIKRALLFARTKHGADRLVRDLKKANINAAAIHGDKSQQARQYALQQFKNNRLTVLVATDIAARGIDVDSLTHVINYDLPNVPETYVHRIGRTGRAGAEGKALSFCDGSELPYLKDINKLIGQTVPIVGEHPFKMSASEAAPRNQAPPQRPGRRPSYQGHNRPQRSNRPAPAARA